MVDEKLARVTEIGRAVFWCVMSGTFNLTFCSRFVETTTH